MADENKIAKEVAEKELENILSHFEVDPADGKDWSASKARLISAISKGRITLKEDESTIAVNLVAPIELENGKGKIESLTFREPMAVDIKALDKYRADEVMAKTIHLASRMTGQPIGIIERMGARDLQTMGAITAIFF